MIATETQRTQRFYPQTTQKTRMMLCVNRCLMFCFSLSDSCYKAIEPLDARKKQDICPQMNTDILKLKNAFIRVHLRLSVDVVFNNLRGAV